MENQFNIPQDAYLSFDAYTLKQFINDRLQESGVFSDQVFEGSNLSVINNIIAYSFNSLMYYLNKTSSESMFSDSQIYENINRIVKILSYKPIGAQTATLPFSLNVTGEDGLYMIPKYSYFTNNGVAYSLVEDIIFDKETNDIAFLENVSNSTLLFQGRFREYSLQKASGDNNYVLTLTTPPDIIIDHFNIDVYVKEPSSGKWIQWDQTENLYLERPSAEKFEIRLNENGFYEIKFGDDINGKRLHKNTEIQVYYLESRGPAGEVGLGFLDQSSFNLFSSSTFLSIYQDSNNSNIPFVAPGRVSATNSNHSTSFQSQESPDDIRENAPGVFRSQLRLVTRDDYKNFILANFRNFIHDVQVSSNDEFLSSRIKYLHDLGLNNPYQDTKVSEAHLQFSDACNFNNVYITAVPRSSRASFDKKFLTHSQKQFITAAGDSRRTLTSNTIIIDPVYMEVNIGIPRANFNPSISDIENSYIIIDKSPNTRRTDNDIKNAIYKVFAKAFDLNVRKLGDKIDISQLNNDILAIDGVQRVWTGRTDNNTKVEGVRMIIYNPSYSQDISVITNNTSLLEFQFAVFSDIDNLVKKILISPPPNKFEIIEA